MALAHGHQALIAANPGHSVPECLSVLASDFFFRSLALWDPLAKLVRMRLIMHMRPL